MRAVEIGVALSVLLSLAACKREPSFDERYDSARKAINAKAGELDRDMARRQREAAQQDLVSPSGEATRPTAPE